ncbi:MAG TPA: DNA ligase (NAD(+)) LigA, partial [Lachnospiraceae bacterium]|nr:DNA ligase (NAD(+)) LigA [Lachnospiraceae bacterium]
IGVANAKVLCRYFDYDLEKMQKADAATLSAVPGVGEVLAGAFTEYMSDAENLEQIEHLKQFLTIEVPQVDENAQTLSGMSFVVTGSLNHYASRNDLKEVIEERGGKVTGSVTGKTTCLINNDITSTSSKNKKAKELQVPILTEEDFLKTYNIPYEE